MALERVISSFFDFPQLEIFNRDIFKENVFPIEKIEGNKYTFEMNTEKFNANDLIITMEENVLLIKGKSEEKNKNMYQARKFIHKINLPENLKKETIKATLENEKLRIEGEVEEKKKKEGERIPIEEKK